MKDYCTVKISTDTLLNMLMDRLDEWHPDQAVRKLYEQMYENYVDGGVFDGGEFDPMLIVDNDWVNYCDVIDSNDENFQKILELYDQGEYDISCEHLGYSFIEAVSNDRDLILVRS